MRPQCKITVDGKLVSGVFMDRLMSCDVTDKEGATSDTVSIELNNHPPAQIPRKGAIIRVWMGYGDGHGQMQFLGSFTVDEVSVTAFPHTMSISGKGADMRAEAKANKERHWDDKSLKDILSDLAGDMGVTLKIDEALGAFKYDWLGQHMESALEVVERLASEHDAIASIKDGKLVFVPKGTGKNAAGASLGSYTVLPANTLPGTARVTFADRSGVKEVTAQYYDRDSAEMKRVKETADD